MTTPTDLDPAALQQRYGLLCRALQATPGANDPQPVLDTVSRLDDLIHRELLALARLGSPDDFADIYLGFARELARFREFCADPRLAEKTVVAFGGPFSAGKSSLINTLMGQKLLVVEVDPTTALPAYVLAGATDAVHALNLHRLRVPLGDDELASLTHDEPHRYGSQVSRALSAAFITRRDFPWDSLAFIDTPGYTGRANAGDRTDADLAATQLGGAHAIVWVVSIKQGNLTEEDLAFLARLDPEIPRIVVASHADLVTEEDRRAVVHRMADTLAARNLPVLGVHAVSARPRHAELLAPLRAQLDAWNQTPRQQRFAHSFKALFTRYQRGLERDTRDAQWQLHRINRLATLANGNLAHDAGELKTMIDERLAALKTVETRLRELRGRFFGELKRAGDTVGIPLPEPHEVDLLEPGRSNLLEQLVALREQSGGQQPDMRLELTCVREKVDIFEPLKFIEEREKIHIQNMNDDNVLMQDDFLVRNYLLLLAALLRAQNEISKNQSRLFLLIINSMRVGDIRGLLFDQARDITKKSLVEIAKFFYKKEISDRLLIDAIILMRIDREIDDDTVLLIGELSYLINKKEEAVAYVAKNASKIFGFEKNNHKINPDSYLEKILQKRIEIWPAEPSSKQKELFLKQAEDANLKEKLRKIEKEKQDKINEIKSRNENTYDNLSLYSKREYEPSKYVRDSSIETIKNPPWWKPW